MSKRITNAMLIAFAGAIIGLAGYGLMELSMPVVVASSAPPDVCEQVAKVGDIVYYYCDPDDGPSFVTNSVGFIVLEQ